MESTGPAGHFITDEYEADCARFLAATKKLARHRAEVALARSAACPGWHVPHQEPTRLRAAAE